ncbi:MAG: peptidylprolyl isomerase [Rhodobacteraceae bacterium]|nr:peptidylprolyl isomerase [Paracoccaceae bacterium]
MASKSSRIFVWIILGLVMVGLVGFGSSNFGGSTSSIGNVGDAEIDTNLYFRELRGALNAQRAQSGQAIPIAMAEEFGLTRQVLERVISATALDNETTRLGLSIGDDILRSELKQMPEFQGLTGGFSTEAYEFTLRESGLTPAGFEATLRTDLSRALLQTAIVSGVEVSPVFTDTLFSFARETRAFTWGKLDLAALENAPGEPSEEALTAYYDAHSADYTLPEIKHVTLAWLRPENLLDSVEVETSRLQELYDERAAIYNQPERRLVERLVFSSEEDAQAAWDALEAGETDFATLVADRGLALSDIDLGDVTSADLDAAGDAVFALTEPGLAGPAASNLGPAIFRMNAILAAQHTPFEDVEAELRAELAVDQARRMVLDQITDMDDLLAGGATLEELTDLTSGMELSALNWSVGSADGIAAYDEFRSAVSETREGDFPELVTLEDGGLFALRIDKADPPRLQELGEVREMVTDGWHLQESLSLLVTQASAMLPALTEGGESLSSLGLTEISEAGQARGTMIAGTPPELIEEVFTIAENDWAILQDVDGVVLMRLDRILPADHTTEEAIAAKAAFSAQMGQEMGLDFEAAFSKALQNQAGITLNQAVISAVHRQFP